MRKPMMHFIVLGLLLAALLMDCAIDPEKVTRPAGVQAYQGSSVAQLEQLGQKLWRDPSLSASGEIACFHCHVNNNNFEDYFARPYPHHIKMAGLELDAEQMVQFCMIMPMEKSGGLAWDSKELAALTAYVKKLQSEFKPAK